jgi:2'-5' RNA ligase
LTQTAILNISLLPSLTVAERLIRESAALETDALFTLNAATRIPHLTLYMARFDGRDLLRASDLAAEVFCQAPPVSVDSLGLHRTSGNYVEFLYKPTMELAMLHSAIVSALAPLRFIPGDFTAYREEYFGPYTGEQRSNVESVGYDLAHELFRPHITLARLSSDVALTPNVTLDGDYAFVAKSGAAFEADELGAGRRMIRRFELGG